VLKTKVSIFVFIINNIDTHQDGYHVLSADSLGEDDMMIVHDGAKMYIAFTFSDRYIIFYDSKKILGKDVKMPKN